MLQSESGHQTTIIAKELGITAIELNKILQSKGVQMRIGNTWVLKSKYQNMGYTKTKTYSYTDSHGITQTSIQTIWTEKGRKFIHEIFSMDLVAI